MLARIRCLIKGHKEAPRYEADEENDMILETCSNCGRPLRPAYPAAERGQVKMSRPTAR